MALSVSDFGPYRRLLTAEMMGQAIGSSGAVSIGDGK
jgi:hypothetical protein